MTMETEGMPQSEIIEIRSLLQSKDNFELVMMRQGIIQISTDVEYHYGLFAVGLFFKAIDKELEKRNVYDLEKCKFFDSVDAALYELKVKSYQLEQQRKNEAKFWKEFANFINH